MVPKWLIPALAYLCFVEGQSQCSTADNKRGDCRSILECPPLRAIVHKPRLTPDEMNFLKKSACGFIDTIPKVCCPSATEQTPSPPPGPKTCFTPEGNQGQCMSVFNCDHIAKRLQSPTVNAEDRAYVNSIRCVSPNPGFNVCCGPPPGPTPPTGLCQPSTAPPDPRTECCGLDGSSANKITGGTATSIDQYPWLAIVEYKKDNKIKLLCGGVLISGRYVLTAGHCVKGTVLDAGTPTNVRLGEYDTSNSGPDCVPVEGGEPGDMDCTTDPVIIPIEHIIPHPEYNPRNPLRRHDIALLRLSELAPYTDFIRPICLPTRDLSSSIPSSGRLFAAGWGAINETHSSSKVKLHVDLPYISLEECQPAYNVPKRRVTLWGGQVCAGGEKGKDSCKGDSGGPLMYSEGSTFEVVGIVSFGPTPCGLENIPGVYTKVFEYLPWIRSNIQP